MGSGKFFGVFFGFVFSVWGLYAQPLSSTSEWREVSPEEIGLSSETVGFMIRTAGISFVASDLRGELNKTRPDPESLRELINVLNNSLQGERAQVKDLLKHLDANMNKAERLQQNSLLGLLISGGSTGGIFIFSSGPFKFKAIKEKHSAQCKGQLASLLNKDRIGIFARSSFLGLGLLGFGLSSWSFYQLNQASLKRKDLVQKLESANRFIEANKKLFRSYEALICSGVQRLYSLDKTIALDLVTTNLSLLDCLGSKERTEVQQLIFGSINNSSI